MRTDDGPEFGGLVLAIDDEQHVLRFAVRTADGVPIVVSSGFAAEELAERLAGRRVAGYLQKPYRLAEIRAIARGALDKR